MTIETAVSRRTVLQTAAGLGLSFLMPPMAARSAERRGPERAKSLLILWMNGGPSQLETWDPHPGYDTGGLIKSTLPGLQIADMYPQMAEHMGDLNVIRSLVSKEGDHERGTYYVKTGYRPDPLTTHPAISAVVSHKRPANTEIPDHISLGGGQWPARGGFLGDSMDAFRIFAPGRGIKNMKPMVKDARQQRRLKSLELVTKTFRRGRKLQTERTLHEEMVKRALTMMSSDQLKALEIEDEPASVRQAYGDSRFGRGCLVARRLLETGVRAIEVTLNGWDSHASNHEGHLTQAAMLDPAFASLMKDLKERDLLQSTVVLCIGEFGRTPNINPLEGRDHWPNWFSCVVGGGGMNKGQIIGRTDPAGIGKKGEEDEENLPENPIEVQDLYATVLQRLGIDHEEEFITDIGRPIAFSPGRPIAQLLG